VVHQLTLEFLLVYLPENDFSGKFRIKYFIVHLHQILVVVHHVKHDLHIVIMGQFYLYPK
jgi:hypothetical protein